MPKKRQPPTKKPTPSSSSSSSSSSSTTTPSKNKATKPVFFHNPLQENGYLSQWYWSPFTISGTTYETAEKWMMHHKATHFSDTWTAAKVLSSTSPAEAKSLGRAVQNFDDASWDTVKQQVVHQGNLYKFTISQEADALRGKLLATGERELVEASAGDRVWGIGFREAEAERNRRRWGGNLLGKVLMDVRRELREKEKGRA